MNHVTDTTLQIILGEPRYADIAELYKQCQQNVAAILSSSGGGQHGWLGMIMPAGVYTMYLNTPWVAPIDPGPIIIYRTATARGAKKFHQMMVTVTTLKNLLYATIKPTYWPGIEDTILGLVSFCVLAIFDWLFWMYGQIYSQKSLTMNWK